LFERIVSLDAEKAYSELKNQLFKENSKLLIDEPSKRIVVEQGSLMGITPKGVKKRIECHFHSQGEKQTRVIVKSSLTPDWVKLNLGSYVFLAVMIGICFFLAFDIENSIAVQRSSLINNLAESLGLISYSQPLFLVSMFQFFGIFLLIIALVGITADLIIYKKRYSFVKEILWILP
jgi:hypothetical protein